MKILFYRSKICPRCYFARKYLRQLIAGDPTIVLEEIDIFVEPGKAFAAGVRVIPTLVAGQNKLGGIWLSQHKIRDFLSISCLQNNVEKKQ